MSEKEVAMLDFNRVDVWIGRLLQLIQAADEWERLARETYESTPRGRPTGAGFSSDSSGFERDQLLSIEAALSHLRNFSKFIASRYTVGMLPPKRSLPSGAGPEAHLLRTILNHLSTDLALIQTALTQRQRVTRQQPARTVPPHVYKQALQRMDGSKIDESDPQRAYRQYTKALQNSLARTKERTKQAATLLFADIMANYALAPAHKYVEHILHETPPATAENKPSVEVVTYFTENTRVRSLPYYPDIVLIGLPVAMGYFEWAQLDSYLYQSQAFDQETDPVLAVSADKAVAFEATIPWELLIIPHEIGHYVFWNGRSLTNNGKAGDLLEDTIMTKLTAPAAGGGLGLASCDWRVHWLEELFCDVYNCLILGPVGVLGLQAIIADADPQTLFHGGGAHPLAGIRPLIASRILERAYPQRFPNAIKQLDKQWNHYLTSVGKAKKLKKAIKLGKRRKGGVTCWGNHAYRDCQRSLERMQKVSLTLTSLLEQLDPVIDVILSVLKIEQPLFDRFGKTADLAPDGDLQSYYPLLLQMTKGPFMGRAVAHQKRTINYGDSQMLAEIKSLSDEKLIEHLKSNYLEIWGDKGPEGGHIGIRG